MILLLAWLAGCPHSGGGEPETPAIHAEDPEARRVLEAAAGALDPEERRVALPALIRVEATPGGGPWGPRGRYNPSFYVQRAVVAALAERSDPESRALIEGLARDVNAEPYTRGVAARVLARDPGRWGRVLGELAAATTVSPEVLLLAAAEAGDAPALARLQARLFAAEIPMNLALPRALMDTRLGKAELGPALAAAVQAVEPEMAPSMAAAWLHVDPDAARPWFNAALAGDPDQAVEAAEWLVALGETGNSPDPVARALLGLARADANDAVKAASEANLDVRVAAARALGRELAAGRGGNAARKALDTLAADHAMLVQLAAIEALGRAGGGEATLRGLLLAESPRVRAAAAAALIGG